MTQDDADPECVRGHWCEDKTIHRDEDGSFVEITAARSPRRICDACVDATAEALQRTKKGTHDLVELFAVLAGEMDALGGGIGAGHTAFGPRLPLRGDVDALRRGITISLVTWQQRLAAVPRLNLSRPSLGDAVANPDGYVIHAAQVLHAHLPQLVALDFYPMKRTRHDELETQLLGGAEACAEILRLHYSAQMTLGEIDPRPEVVLGVHCYQCHGYKTLIRADPPLKPGDTVWYSVCRRCGHKLTYDQFRHHGKRLVALARGQRATLAPDEP